MLRRMPEKFINGSLVKLLNNFGKNKKIKELLKSKLLLRLLRRQLRPRQRLLLRQLKQRDLLNLRLKNS